MLTGVKVTSKLNDWSTFICDSVVMRKGNHHHVVFHFRRGCRVFFVGIVREGFEDGGKTTTWVTDTATGWGWYRQLWWRA